MGMFTERADSLFIEEYRLTIPEPVQSCFVYDEDLTFVTKQRA